MAGILNNKDRAGIRFGGTGTAGQVLAVQNSGGRNLTLHATTGTAHINTTTAADTLAPGGVYLFMSDGTTWNLIGGSGGVSNVTGLSNSA